MLSSAAPAAYVTNCTTTASLLLAQRKLSGAAGLGMLASKHSCTNTEPEPSTQHQMLMPCSKHTGPAHLHCLLRLSLQSRFICCAVRVLTCSSECLCCHLAMRQWLCSRLVLLLLLFLLLLLLQCCCPALLLCLVLCQLACLLLPVKH